MTNINELTGQAFLDALRELKASLAPGEHVAIGADGQVVILTPGARRPAPGGRRLINGPGSRIAAVLRGLTTPIPTRSGALGMTDFELRTFDRIEPVDPEWVWPGRVPCGTVTVLAAPGGVGKSFPAPTSPRVSPAAT